MKTIRKQKETARGIPESLMTIIALVAIPLAAVIVYLPAFNGGWIWDDGASVFRNPLVTDRQDGLYRTWFTTDNHDYWPMTTTAFWIQYQIFKNQGKPAGEEPSARNFHIVNVLLHALAAVLIFLVLKRLAIPGAILAGLVFAVHPINAVSVVWVSEMKNLLSMIFIALTLLCYLRFERLGHWRWYGMALAAFTLALASKTSVVMLPFGLLGLAWWRRGRIGRRDIILSGGFFLLSAVMAGMTVLVQNRHMGVLTKPLDGIYRLAGAGWVMWFYIYKTLLPVKMSMIYPHWKETIESLGWISFLPTAALAGIFAVLFLKRRTRWARPVLFAFGYFVLAVFPVLGFFNMSFMMHSLVADHFQYLPIIGVISLVCAACWMLAQNRKPQTRAIMGTVAAGVLVLLGMQTFRRANVLKDELSLWRNTVEVNGEAWMAQYNLGNMISRPTDTMFEQINASRKKSTELSGRAKALRDTGNLKQARIYDQLSLKHKNQAEAEYQKARTVLLLAESHYRKSIEIQPMHAWSYNNLGVSLLKLERIDEAIEQYRKGIEMDRLSLIRKRTPILPYNLGNALLKKERFEEAADAFKQSYLTHYTYENALNKALSTYRRLGKYNECIELLNAHLKRHPEDPGAHQSLSKYLIETGKVDQAVKHIKQSIDLAPTNPLPHMTEGEILVKANRPAEAVESFHQAIRFNRQKHMLRDDNLQIKLAEALSLAGRNADALATLALVLRSNPNHGHARESLRNLMKQLGHTPQAAECYEETLKVIPDWIDGLQKLAWIRATHPDPNVRDASQALGLVKNLSSRINNDPIVLDTFAAALAENKQFPQAVSAAKKALKIARDEKNEDLARQIEDRLGLYEKGRPYRENR